MAKTTSYLSDKQLKSAKPKTKEYVLTDVNGLRLRITSNGVKRWLVNYKDPVSDKRTNLSLGTYPIIALATARKLTMEVQELIALGISPKEHREAKKREQQSISEHTLFNVASQWFELKKDAVTADYSTDIWRSFEMYFFPKFGDTPISELTAPNVIMALRPIEARGNLETVKRLVQRINEVMTYAVNCGLVFSNPLAGIKEAFKKPKKQHMAALTPEELPELMNALAGASIKKVTRSLIEWQLHTMTRPAEAAGARWEEIDLEERVWNIPPARMKKGREHRIPLTDEAVAILDYLQPISGHREFVFPSDRDPKKHCNSQTANMALKRMGFANRLVSHGLRSIASTTLNEQGFEPDLIEVALAHVDKNQIRSAYNRTDFLDRRRPMMSWWSGHIITASQGSLSVTGTKQLKVVTS
ncbi:integrase domain-containing protein [Vibrio europaeus]|uniref:Integrase domain-containing protein n=1 Tax=Vibrio europaeus TaxID=300876 RepID=A0ABT5GTA2_9VIBR|nr:integrase domain-containing protein [Vibrio europaeus]MDC5703462.1 integrase domain-containing protein [Vibrio europaeus]MDC5711383.1 integrase domain-containing protein [Vibrio europaeus]MDC5714876.1 integrase domain-containing protein [Vibrio europaeus]MDC5727494.1 integrase domain-containing protein [Vibrio europaeus]MDC5729729.1 integrase domain-containing protein [Vibrio europaeus]